MVSGYLRAGNNLSDPETIDDPIDMNGPRMGSTGRKENEIGLDPHCFKKIDLVAVNEVVGQVNVPFLGSISRSPTAETGHLKTHSSPISVRGSSRDNKVVGLRLIVDTVNRVAGGTRPGLRAVPVPGGFAIDPTGEGIPGNDIDPVNIRISVPDIAIAVEPPSP
ncbi:MAG: hypothetical protein BWY82_01472 [Verrucomicrobia bacterium ADurb.Bin474]|nr:MAG: hypothetical protein BWY82_01472 [Verrucomicrobia bacterium ADurb.Bin474]